MTRITMHSLRSQTIQTFAWHYLQVSELKLNYYYTKIIYFFSTNFALVVDDLSEVLIALKDVTDWYTLGIHLRLKASTLDRIRHDFKDGRYAKEEMIKLWLEQDPESIVPGSTATWKTLVKALIIMDENKVAKTIEEDVSYKLLDPYVLS